jgi:CxxC motif-containing protein (DUF1111 family)
MKSKAVWLVMVLLAGVGLIRSQTERSLAPGSTLPGISPMEAELFRIGLEDFLEVESAEEGLGPAFNGRSCAECHNQPAVGGASVMTETRAGFVDEHGRFRALNGDTLYQLFSVPPHRCQVQIPVEANVIARRAPIPLFGAGLVEAIPDETIVANEDPEDANGDGISGLAARITDVATGRERIGRFGWKAQHATLLAFSADAYRNEMGITNDLFREEMALAVDPEHMRLCDSRRDPEDRRDPRTGRRGIDNFENFMKLLAPIERGPATAEVSRGEELFSTVGCAACHTPRMTTGPSANPIFDRKPVHLYSDLLLHDVGTGDGIVQGPASAQEIRTPALWGLRLRRPLLHDGTAATADQAIRKHGAEAARVRERYLELPHDDRAALLAFLNSL